MLGGASPLKAFNLPLQALALTMNSAVQHGLCRTSPRYPAFHYDLDYAQLYAQNQFYANRGYVVLSINYRGGPGYGALLSLAINLSINHRGGPGYGTLLSLATNLSINYRAAQGDARHALPSLTG
jgi:hypothetical protein